MALLIRILLGGLVALLGWRTSGSPWGAIGGLAVGLFVPELLLALERPWRRVKPRIPWCVHGVCVGPESYVLVAFNQPDLGVQQRPGIAHDGWVRQCRCGAEHFAPDRRLFAPWEWFVVGPNDELVLLSSARPFRRWQRHAVVGAPARAPH